MICDGLDINVWELIALANRHPRVNILQPGAGVGGHCIAVDPWFIVDTSPDDAKIIRTAREVNEHKPEWVVQKIKVAVADALAVKPGKTLADIKVACLGLAFKPDIDDLRESPALDIAANLMMLGCSVIAVEPNITLLPNKLISFKSKLMDIDEALSLADVVCVLVKHSEFIEHANEIKKKSIVIDLVGLVEV
jgi:UDP-N-acetyl-D-mannosaminuronic acid dehydrogenase